MNIQMKEKEMPKHETTAETKPPMDFVTLLKKAPSFILKAILIFFLFVFLQKLFWIVADFVVYVLTY